MRKYSNILSIMVPTMNRIRDLERLLESMATQDILPGQVIIIDGTVIPQQEIMNNYKELNIKYIHAPCCSVAAARNIGINNLNSNIELVSVLDDDIVLLDNAVSNMLKYWESAPGDVGAAVFNVVNFRDSTILAYLKMLFCAWNKEKGVVMRSGVNTMLFPASEDKYVQWIPSGIMVLRRGIFQDFKYDEWYKNCFCEDLDFGYRVGKKYKLRIISTAKVKHLHSSVSRPNRIQFGKTQITDRYHFIKKDLEYFSKPLFHLANVAYILENIARGIFGCNQDYLKAAYGNVLGVCAVIFGHEEK